MNDDRDARMIRVDDLPTGENAETFGIEGHEELTVVGLTGTLTPRQDVTVDMARPDGTRSAFVVTARLDSLVEINYYRNGGILHTVLRKMLAGRAGV